MGKERNAKKCYGRRKYLIIGLTNQFREYLYETLRHVGFLAVGFWICLLSSRMSASSPTLVFMLRNSSVIPIVYLSTMFRVTRLPRPPLMKGQDADVIQGSDRDPWAEVWRQRVESSRQMSRKQR